MRIQVKRLMAGAGAVLLLCGAAAAVAQQLPGTQNPVPLTTPIIATARDGGVFPVFGDAASFTNDYGAPRAGTGWHQGIDIFAPIGTPVVAVADGELYSVGVNTLGGNRLWLKDGAGTTYYYAHLSAYAPGVVDGATVRAGQVIGFVGNTGQALTTPPHLHFEVHPGDGASINPYAALRSWRGDAPAALPETSGNSTLQPATPATQPLPQVTAAARLAGGATLVGIEPATISPRPAGDGRAVAVR